MDNKVDVARELKEKNKEIFFNKLNMDIETNNESLTIQLHNMINNIMNDFASKLLEINEISDNSQIQEVIIAFRKVLIDKLDQLLFSRQQRIGEEGIKENVEIFGILEAEKNAILNAIEKIYIGNIPKFMKLGEKYSNFQLERLKHYLSVSFKETLMFKIKKIIENSDKIFSNNYSESLVKYQKLNDIKVR